MITRVNLDELVQTIQSTGEADIFYVAHRIERRRGTVDDFLYKSAADFEILKLKLKGVTNAYFKYLDYLENPNDYHTESEESYIEPGIKHVNYYTVPNAKESYTKDFNPRIPSIIFGRKRKLYNSTGILVADFNDPSFVTPWYTNSLIYWPKTAARVMSDFESGNLDWKYRKLDEAVKVDGVDLWYMTSDYYILDIENFPKVEMPLICVDQQNAYFTNVDDALSCLKQLKA